MSDCKDVFGIDLGTTYSCIAQIDEYGKPVVLRNSEGDATTPSVVFFESEKNIVVGKEAKNSLAIDPLKTVAFVKREMGVDKAFDKATNTFPMHWDPSEISAAILKKLVKDANTKREEDGNDPVKNVVITCPAYFGTKERAQTKQAGIIAGLNVLSIINEPVAAAISYGVKLEEPQTVLVYDLGGGTFDISVIKVDQGKIRVVVTGGDRLLGGKDWDAELAKYALDAFNHANGTSYSFGGEDENSKKLENTFILEAEKAKRALTAKEKTRMLISYEGKQATVEITRQQYDELTKDLLQQTLNLLDSLLKSAKDKGCGSFDRVLLVGGSSRMPQVKAAVDAKLGCDAKLTDPDECVAKGAAIYAMNRSYEQALLDYEEGKATTKPQEVGLKTDIVNVTSKTYGFGIIGERVVNVLLINTPVPFEDKITLYTTKDNQTGVNVSVWESNLADSKIKQIQAVKLEEHFLPFAEHTWPKETPIEHYVKVDAEGMMFVHAEHKEPDKAPDILEFKVRLPGVKNQQELETSTAMLCDVDVN